MQVPDEWVNPPTLPLHLAWIRDAFEKLSTCRGAGFTATPIPWRDIKVYSHDMRLDSEADEWFVTLIMNLDSAVLKYYRDKEPKKDEK